MSAVDTSTVQVIGFHFKCIQIDVYPMLIKYLSWHAAWNTHTDVDIKTMVKSLLVLKRLNLCRFRITTNLKTHKRAIEICHSEIFDFEQRVECVVYVVIIVHFVKFQWLLHQDRQYIICGLKFNNKTSTIKNTHLCYRCYIVCFMCDSLLFSAMNSARVLLQTQ